MNSSTEPFGSVGFSSISQTQDPQRGQRSPHRQVRLLDQADDLQFSEAGISFPVSPIRDHAFFSVGGGQVGQGVSSDRPEGRKRGVECVVRNSSLPASRNSFNQP